MSIVREGDLLCAASYLCTAADNLRAIGLLSLADEIEAFIALLDAEISLGSPTND
jgi:hypothetical protein